MNEINDPTWRSPDTVTFTLTQPTTYVVKVREGYVTGDDPEDASLVCIDLWAEGEHVVTYTGDYDEEIPLPDADYIVDAAIAAGVFVPALDERT
jgi:hypothetical protein